MVCPKYFRYAVIAKIVAKDQVFLDKRLITLLNRTYGAVPNNGDALVLVVNVGKCPNADEYPQQGMNEECTFALPRLLLASRNSHHAYVGKSTVH